MDSTKTTNTAWLNDQLTISSIGTDTIDLSPGAVGMHYDVSYGAMPSLSISNTGLSNTVWTTSTADWNIGSSKLTQSGTMELRGNDADIVVNGRSLMDAIDALEQRLNILVPNPELEAEWDELRRLGDRYRKLEKKCKEKAEMWNKLKEIRK
jgi:hypothetical protein